jgi:hypothetical protein
VKVSLSGRFHEAHRDAAVQRLVASGSGDDWSDLVILYSYQLIGPKPSLCNCSSSIGQFRVAALAPQSFMVNFPAANGSVAATAQDTCLNSSSSSSLPSLKMATVGLRETSRRQSR